jgi:hypothetical protein
VENLQRRLRSVGDLEAAVDETLGALTLAPEDAAAAALARRYGQQIDEAAHAEAIAERAIKTLMEDDGDDGEHRRYVYALAAKVEAKELLDKLGPKLLAVLESVGATPAARSRLKGGKPANAAPSQLAELRRTHGKRPA